MTHIVKGCWTASWSRIHCSSLAPGLGTPSAWCRAHSQIGDVCGKQYETCPMEHDDQQVGQRWRKPTRLQLRLKVAVLHTESSDTLYSGVAWTWTPWCRASCLPPRGWSHRQRLASELPENPSTTNPSLGIEVAGVQPHNAHNSQLASSWGHSVLPAIVLGWLAIEVVEVGHCHMKLGHAHVRRIPLGCQG
jgi:hypothetical protein